MDNVKSKANQAAAKAQESLAQGQEKFNELQARRASDKLLTDLGRAVWAHQRTGGSPDAVNEILGKLDAWAAEHGPIDTTVSDDEPLPASPPLSAAPPQVDDTPPLMGSDSPPPPPPPPPMS